MKVKENRLVTITYCDYCKQEIRGLVSTLMAPDKKENHYCNEIKRGEKESCLIKHKRHSWKVNKRQAITIK